MTRDDISALSFRMFFAAAMARRDLENNPSCSLVINESLIEARLMLAALNGLAPASNAERDREETRLEDALDRIPPPTRSPRDVAIEEAARNALVVMQKAWNVYGIGGLFELMEALRAALALKDTP